MVTRVEARHIILGLLNKMADDMKYKCHKCIWDELNKPTVVNSNEPTKPKSRFTSFQLSLIEAAASLAIISSVFMFGLIVGKALALH